MIRISTDSRSIKKGDLFIALSGPNFDGHDYVLDAFKKGASKAVISKDVPNLPKNKKIIKVTDTLAYLQKLANLHRKKTSAKIIAVTGSSGKTTTKDMIASVLSQGGKTLKTAENLNNEIGVPQTLLQIDKSHKYAVVEMGMQNKGEIELLAKISLPNAAVLTNVGEAHIGTLRTKKNIAKAKSEIFKFLKASDFAILNADDPYFEFQKKQIKDAEIVSFGLSNNADVRAQNIKENNNSISFGLLFNGIAHSDVSIPIPGKHNVYNALAAICVGLIYGISPKKIAKGLSTFKSSLKRMQIITLKNGARIINDSYNANPSSMKAVLRVLSSQKGNPSARKIAVLGDMLELGMKANYYHRQIGTLINELDIDILIAMGNLAKEVYLSAKKQPNSKGRYFFKNKEEAFKKLQKIMSPGDIILLKGSRVMKMEEILEKILDNNI